jgi:Transposase DDE domain
MEVLDRLIGAVRRCCEGFPDPRTGHNGSYAMADFGLAAFSVFFAQSPSFLAHQRQLAAGHGRSNANTLFGMSRIPGDSHIRRMLDPVAPDHLFPVFDEVISDLERAGGLAAFQRLGSRVLIALDGTEYHRSTRVHCPHCSTRTRAGQPTEHFHTLLAATIVAPGHTHVVPLAPEFIGPQDGHDKQDCESRAVRRWLARHGPGLARLDPVYLGDDLYACQPVCEAVLAQGGHFLFTCKPSSHQTLQEYLTGIDLTEHVERVKRGKQRFTHRYRWLCDVPLRGDEEALTVNWLQIEILDAAGAVTYRNSFVTDLPVDASSVAELAACGRARWKIENESFNVLKTGGYHLEHNFGHGKEHLSALLACLNLLAFAIHTVCDLAEGAWRKARTTLGPRVRFFQNLQALTSYLVFSSWTELLHTLAFARPPPSPSG